ncbi:uncharacterized protein LOC127085452 [Lathyrus oleraceus]|uniref:Uncharacterized protein n=1 Tax=Pisum sativum TaxID=3888 RepID=A0A9D5AK00_PEA|nr:uncharacterized protein LOC127085452 [Pisum sativum]KAI5410196.1 hypothetical protein KIW84_055614 [Pisum sativum]
MYPQPFNSQQQEQQQPYYSFFPRTSDSSLHPPGTNPVANSAPFPATQTADYQNWVAQQPEPIGYDLPNAAGSSYETSAPSAWNATWPHQVYGNETTTMLPNQTKFTHALRCEVCKLDVNSRDSYEKHIAGKKHKKNLQSGISSFQVQALIGPVVKQPETKNQVVQSKVCTTCNVLCTSHDTYIKHIAGKKHAAQVCLMSNGGIGPSIAEFKRNGVAPFQKAAKKIKVAQSAWCETCKINCNSRDMYITHLAGKKHLKNLEKLSNPKIDVGTSSTATASNTLIGPQEKPGTDKPKATKASELDIEAKKRKVVEGGTAVNNVKTCTLCNVVCNSETVFNLHLVGQKHAAMVKKAG